MTSIFLYGDIDKQLGCSGNPHGLNAEILTSPTEEYHHE
jgi:hypothetical protein